MAIQQIPAPIQEQLKLIKTQDAPAGEIDIICLDQVTPEPVTWLWKPYIAKRKLTVVSGEEGIGKSWISCALASIVSNGWRFPGAAEETEPGKVLFLALEDGLTDTLKPRLITVRANHKNVFSITSYFSFDELGLLRFYNLLERLRPTLVIIDPFFAYLAGGLNINLATEIRPITSKLADYADEFNAAFLLVRHIGKSKGLGDARAAGIGSIDLRAAARSELLVGRDPANPNQGAIVQIKNNLEKFGDPVGYEISDGQLYFLQESHLTADKILAARVHQSDDEKAETADAMAFLREALRDGERETGAVKKEAFALGISEKMLRTARGRLGVEVIKRGNAWGRNQKYYWRLNLPETEESTDPQRSDFQQTIERLTSDPE